MEPARQPVAPDNDDMGTDAGEDCLSARTRPTPKRGHDQAPRQLPYGQVKRNKALANAGLQVDEVPDGPRSPSELFKWASYGHGVIKKHNLEKQYTQAMSRKIVLCCDWSGMPTVNQTMAMIKESYDQEGWGQCRCRNTASGSGAHGHQCSSHKLWEMDAKLGSHVGS